MEQTVKPQEDGQAGNAGSGWVRLFIFSAAIAVVWLFVLPNISQLEFVRHRSKQLREAKVEADAMFYSELNWTPPPGAYFR